MPTYQYSCNDCGHFFEIVQSFSDDSLTVCPECEGRLRKVFNAVGVVFKGSGFYRTDSRNQKTGAEAGSGVAPAQRATARRSPTAPAVARMRARRPGRTAAASPRRAPPAPPAPRRLPPPEPPPLWIAGARRRGSPYLRRHEPPAPSAASPPPTPPTGAAAPSTARRAHGRGGGARRAPGRVTAATGDRRRVDGPPRPAQRDRRAGGRPRPLGVLPRQRARRRCRRRGPGDRPDARGADVARRGADRDPHGDRRTAARLPGSHGRAAPGHRRGRRRPAEGG